jgi:hypothetical protein
MINKYDNNIIKKIDEGDETITAPKQNFPLIKTLGFRHARRSKVLQTTA